MIGFAHHRSEWRNAAFIGAAWAAVLLIIAALLDPNVAAAGWLVGFVFWTEVLIGALTLVMIHRLTGGRWGEIAAPVIEPAAAVVPALIVLVIPVFVSIPTLYPWPHHPAAIKTDVLTYYLNEPAFVVRSLIGLIGWSALAFFLPRVNGPSGQFLSGQGLVFHALLISSVSIDWYLSLEAPFTSSSFGAGIAVVSLVAALAWTAVLMPANANDPAIGDIGGLLLATILGITYIDFMAVLVIWYGDLPHEEIWFVKRGFLPWSALALAAFLLASSLPILALLLSKVRNARAPLRVVGVGVLIGIACYDAYLIAPPAGSMALITALIAIIGIGLALLGLIAVLASTMGPSPEIADAR